MEGGIAILLLLMLVVVVGAGAVLFTGLGGALGLSRRKDSKDAADDGQPVHSRPTTPYHEHTRLTPSEHDDARSEAGSTRD
jgi:hypothetical protein